MAGTENSRKIHLVNYNSICEHKNFGGLGIPKAFSMNRALLMKLAWRLIQDSNSTWTNIFKARYQFNGTTKAFDNGENLVSCQG